MTTAEQIARIIVERLELPSSPDTLSRQAALFGPVEYGGLGIDSVASLEIVAAMSDHFDLPFADLEGKDLFSIESLAAYVDRHRAAKAGT